MIDQDSPTTQMRLDMAEMKGMLTVSLQTHSSRLDAQDNRIGEMTTMLNTAITTLGVHATEIQGLKHHDTTSANKHDKDIAELKASQSGLFGKSTTIITLVIAATAFLIGIMNDFGIGN